MIIIIIINLLVIVCMLDYPGQVKHAVFLNNHRHIVP